MGKCGVCGLGLVAAEESKGVCYKCEQGGSIGADQLRREEREKEAARLVAINGVMLTTEAFPSGLVIERRIEIVTAECAFGMNIFRDLFAGVRDLFGGRSGATQKVLRDARRKVLDELKIEAYGVGADAVVGVTLNYSEFSGGEKSMLFVVAAGTAVKLGDI